MKKGKRDEIKREYDLILAMFDDIADRKKVAAIDGLILAAAEAKVNLDALQRIVDRDGVVEFHPSNPSRYRLTPAARELPKFSASYSDKIDRLTRWHERWAGQVEDKEVDELAEWE